MSRSVVQPVQHVAGTVQVPSDKSISHRAALLSALAHGDSDIENFLESADCLATLQAVRDIGVGVDALGPGHYRVHGKGAGHWRSPQNPLDLGNSGTGTRLLVGLLAGCPGLVATVTGDASLCRRPMGRILEPLRRMGASIAAQPGNVAPLGIAGAALHGIEYRMDVASAQVKSAVLLAGLQAQGKTVVHEPAPSRNHTERMIRFMGGHVTAGGGALTLEGPQRLTGKTLRVPGDPSSAAFLLAAALLLEGSHITVQNVCLNPLRTGFLQVLRDMGAKIEAQPDARENFETTGSLRAEHSVLHGVTLDDPALIANVIDEIPILAVLAAKAQGITTIRNAQELRVKETDRIKAICKNLQAIGVRVEEFPDGFNVTGPARFHAAAIDSYKDHRIAMSFAVAGLCAEGPMQISNTEFIATSFPGFFDLLASVAGAR